MIKSKLVETLAIKRIRDAIECADEPNSNYQDSLHIALPLKEGLPLATTGAALTEPAL